MHRSVQACRDPREERGDMVVACSILGARGRASSSPADLTPKLQPFVELNARVRFWASGKSSLNVRNEGAKRTGLSQGDCGRVERTAYDTATCGVLLPPCRTSGSADSQQLRELRPR